MKSNSSNHEGFSLIELLVVIVVIGILAAIGIVSYRTVQINTRDTKRSSSISVLAESLEDYYKKNGSYPSCITMAQSANNVAASVLTGISPDILATPSSSSGVNSIQAACADLTGASADLYSYVGDSSANCTTGTSCSRYILKYKEESTGSVVTLRSRYGIDKSFAATWGGAGGENASSMTKTSDGGYLIAGETDSFGGGIDAFLSKFNSSGVLLWSKTFGGSGTDYTGAILETSDGGIATTGFTSSFGSGSFDAYLAKYTKDGVLSWSRTWGGADDDRPYALVQTSDGGFAVGGYTVSYDVGNGDAFLAKFTSVGDLSWSRVFGSGGADYINGIVQLSDGDYVVVGDTSSLSYTAGDYDGFIAKIESDSTMSWFKTAGGVVIDSYKNIIKNTDGTYIAVGYTDSFGSGARDGYITRYSANGDWIWSKALGGTGEDAIQGVSKYVDDTFLVAGYAYSFGSGNSDILSVKYSTDGSLVWANTFGGASFERGWNISNTTDGGFAVSGFSYVNAVGSYDAALLKYSSDGMIINCLSTMCRRISPTSMSISPVLGSYRPVNSAPNATITIPPVTPTSRTATSRITVAP